MSEDLQNRPVAGRGCLQMEAADCLNYAALLNRIPAIHGIHVLWQGEKPLRDARLAVTCEPAFAQAWERIIPVLEPGSSLRLDDLEPVLSPGFFSVLEERMAGVWSIRLLDGDQEVGRQDVPVDLLAFDEWSGLRGLPEILAAFVLPNHPGLRPFAGQVSDRLQSVTGGSALDGYQSKDRQRVWHMCAAIWECCHAQGLRYCNPPASFETQGQKVRTPEVVLGDRLGTCLDLSLITAALLEMIGLRPLLILLEGHCFVGCWLIEDRFPCAALDD
ncbi:MAG: DNA helicase, partial [Planctomycetota bacterium]